MASGEPGGGTSEPRPRRKAGRLAEPENPRDASMFSREVESAHGSHGLLQNVMGTMECSDAITSDCTTSCTASEEKRCELFMQLDKWNKRLLPANLQLREVSGARPQLSLASSTTPSFEDPTIEQVQKAVTRARLLLRSHQCIVTLKVSLQLLRGQGHRLFDALERSYLKYLKISHYSSKSIDNLARALPFMERLEELEFGYGQSSWQLQEALSKLLRYNMPLKVLRMQKLKLHEDTSELVRMLFVHSSLTELSFHLGLLKGVGAEFCENFKKYIEKTATLETLNLFGTYTDRYEKSTLSTVLRGLLRNQTVRNLGLTDLYLNCETTGLLTKLFEGPNFIRCFKVTSKNGNLGTPNCQSAHNHSSWLLAVARSKVLEEVTLSIQSCNGFTWKLFLAALSKNANAMKVVIEGEPDIDDDALLDICTALGEHCLDDQVSISSQVSEEELDLLMCKALSRVLVFAGIIWWNNDHWPVFQRLSSFNHVTSLRIMSPWNINEAMFIAIAQYVAATMTLKELHFQMLFNRNSREDRFRCWTIFSNSLSRNKSIRNVGIHTMFLHDEVSELLADTILSRKDTWRVDFNFGPDPPSVFIRRLSLGIADNFNLLNVTMHGTIPRESERDWLLVDAAVRRNSGLLTRAAQFAIGTLRDRCGAQALERIHGHPASLEELMQVASVGRDEAAHMIRRALRSVEDMHAFMALSGVVRERVVCLPRQDGRPQLDNLNEYCWRKVRRYLLVEHVRNTEES